MRQGRFVETWLSSSDLAISRDETWPFCVDLVIPLTLCRLIPSRDCKILPSRWDVAVVVSRCCLAISLADPWAYSFEASVSPRRDLVVSVRPGQSDPFPSLKHSASAFLVMEVKKGFLVTEVKKARARRVPALECGHMRARTHSTADVHYVPVSFFSPVHTPKRWSKLQTENRHSKCNRH